MEEEILNIEEFLEKIKKKKRRDIYLDYNIIIELQELKEKNAKLFKKYLNILSKHKIYYSYGHLEELSTHKWKDESLKKARIKFIEELTQNNEIIYEQYSDLLLAKFEKKKKILIIVFLEYRLHLLIMNIKIIFLCPIILIFKQMK